MKQNQFVRINSKLWQMFETSCNDEYLHGNDARVTDFPQQYRQICGQLALARSRHYSPALINKLNGLVLLGQSKLYQGESFSLMAMFKEFRHSFASALFENRLYIITAFILFFGLALIAFVWVLNFPDAVYHFLDPKAVKNIDRMYDPNDKIQNIIRKGDSDFVMFATYIYNNIGIAFSMFAGGALLCIGALFPLLFNSFYFGAISGHVVNKGFEDTFFSFVITHGAFELTAIVIAGAAGFKLGYKLINPGKYTRAYALKKAGASVLPLIIGAFVMLVLAAFIEAFWSPQDIPKMIKYSVGSLCWLYVAQRLYKGCRYGT